VIITAFRPEEIHAGVLRLLQCGIEQRVHTASGFIRHGWARLKDRECTTQALPYNFGQKRERLVMPPTTPELTELLARWRRGDGEAADRLLAATYEQLRRLARGFLRRERPDHTMQPTALVHEAYLRLFKDQPVDLESRDAFFRLVAAQMRRELIDHARRHHAVKRGGRLVKADFEEVIGAVPASEAASDEEIFVRLETALARFEHEHPRAGRVVRLRFFGGLSNDEVAEALDLSSGTVKRDFTFARAWLARELDPRRREETT
jgi:RNA polymerase sigma factor (TIGR02999 family)